MSKSFGLQSGASENFAAVSYSPASLNQALRQHNRRTDLQIIVYSPALVIPGRFFIHGIRHARTDVEDIVGQIFSSEPAPFVGKIQYVFKISDLVSADDLTAGVGQLIFIFIEKDKVDIFSGKNPRERST